MGGPSNPKVLPEAPASASSGSIHPQASGFPRAGSLRAAWDPLAFGLALGLLAAVAGSRPALAADLENGEAIFGANCAACHAGGNNSVVAEKKIKKEQLEKYLFGGYNVDAIKTQVTNGKNSMPAFGEKLGLMTLTMLQTGCSSKQPNGTEEFFLDGLRKSLHAFFPRQLVVGEKIKK